MRVSLQSQPFQILCMLLERPGEVVTRQQMQERLWPADTFVDFEHSLNSAVKKLRQALGDSSENPRFIETLARRGYRFIAPVAATPAPVNQATPTVVEPVPPSPAEATPSRGAIARWPRVGVIAATAAVALLIGGGVARLFPRLGAAEPPILAELTYSGHDSSPAVSPDGKTIAFTSERDGTKRIWLEQLGPGDEIALTSGPDDGSPRISSDGSSVLFVRREAGRGALYRISLLGGEAHRLLEDAMEGDWSPDGRSIAFVRHRVEKDNEWTTSVVGVAAADGSGAREIARFPRRFLLAPRWSPDGTLIALTEAGYNQYRIPGSIVLVRPDGRPSRFLTPPVPYRFLSGVAWTGNGEEIVYSQTERILDAVRGTWGRVILQNIRSGDTRTLLWRPNVCLALDVAGPGKLAFDAVATRENLREVSLDARLAPSPGRWLTRGNTRDRQPRYSSDGEWVIFSSDRSGNLDLWKVSTRDGSVHRLTNHPAEDWDPTFSGDGKRIFWSSNRTGHFEVWTALADGSEARQLTNDGVEAENPSATQNGAWIVFVSANEAKAGIWKIRADGSRAALLAAGTNGLPELSPDGKHVLYVHYHGARKAVVEVVGLEDGRKTAFQATVQVAAAEPRFLLGRARWTPDGRAIAFIGADDRGVSGIYIQDFAADRETSRSRRPLFGFDPEVVTESFAFGPDGRHLAVAVGEQLSSLFLASGLRGVVPASRGR